MRRIVTFAATMTLMTAVACDMPSAPTASEGPGLEPDGSAAAAIQGVSGFAAGGGELTVAGVLTVEFAFNAVQLDPSGGAVGQARHSVVVGGELVEFHTTVTCMTADATNSRAWIGGTIRTNNSTHPGWMGAIHQPGADIWFRVVDNGEGSNALSGDRSTFVGFEGSAGIITSQEYCDTQPWPDGDAGTNPLTAGNIQVRG